MTELGINTEYELRNVERKLEEIGRSICSAKGASESWDNINTALKYVRDAIRSAWKIED